MTDDSDDRELSERLEDAERRLAAIAEIASGQVGATGMAIWIWKMRRAG